MEAGYRAVSAWGMGAGIWRGVGIMNCSECNEPMHAATMAELFPGTYHGGTTNGDVIGECQTLVGYHSEPGHNHDDNCLHRIYLCQNGHRKPVYLRRKCPACDWKGKE